jgi:hypothetical protein
MYSTKVGAVMSLNIELYGNVIGRKEQPKKIKLLTQTDKRNRPSMSSGVELGTMQNLIDICLLFIVCDEKTHYI